jgi:hypothetical protein
MPEEEVIERAHKDAEEGKSTSTQAGEFIREEMHHIREGKHGARSPQQAIAIGLSKARRAGVDLKAPKPGKATPQVRKQAEKDLQKGKSSSQRPPSAVRSRATLNALKQEGHSAASPRSLAGHAHRAAQKRGKQSLRNAARRAVKTKGTPALRRAGQKAARTRARNRMA